MAESETRIDVHDASTILTTVATRWMHRFPVRYDAMTAEVHIDNALLVMTADADGLKLTIVAADGPAMKDAQLSVEQHVDNVVDGEAFKYDWSPWQ